MGWASIIVRLGPGGVGGLPDIRCSCGGSNDVVPLERPWYILLSWDDLAPVLALSILCWTVHLLPYVLGVVVKVVTGLCVGPSQRIDSMTKQRSVILGMQVPRVISLSFNDPRYFHPAHSSRRLIAKGGCLRSF